MSDYVAEKCELLARDDLVGQNFIYNNDINIKYVSYREKLCPSQYDNSIRCFWEGDLEITLNVNGKDIVINDHDQRKGKISMIGTRNAVYQFQGLGPRIVNNDENQTYLVFKITKCLN